MSKITGDILIDRFEKFAPKHLAEKGDPIGLAIGTLNKPLNKVMVTLDVRPEVVEEAIEKQVDLIFAHHPPIFRPISNLNTDDSQTKMYSDLLKNDIAVYSAHTNLDSAEGGMNDWLAEKIGLINTEVLSVTKKEAYQKLIVFVPFGSEKNVLKELYRAGAAEINENRTDVSIHSTVTRQVKLDQSATDTSEFSKEDFVAEEETKIEVSIIESKIDSVISALLKAHPHKDPLYDIVPLLGEAKEYGLGRIGNLKRPVTLKEYVKTLADVFGVSGLRYVTEDIEKPIQKIAILGGDGGNFYRDALNKGADVFVTGDVYYHTAHDMLADGLSVVDPGHHIESICKPYLTELFQRFALENNWEIDVFSSECNTDPFQFYVVSK